MTDSAARLSQALADRYTIERELGAGGMATVYLAQDLKHHRQVAIKVLKPELAAVLGADRFVQEITTTAQLQHPNILPLFDSGRAVVPPLRDTERGTGGEAFLYYVMPYVEGETLRARLDRETQLGVDESVQLVAEVADALQYAHEHGVVHRDIKPENILLHAGRPMVADFGIALAVSAAAGGRLTETGLSLGTPHYMSPEQATADKSITNRSDIYSLGCVLYEMLAGQPPHLGGSAQQIIMRIVTDEARPISELRKAVPPHLAAALGKALEKLPADRFASAREFAEALHGRGITPAMLAASAVRPVAASGRQLARHPLVLGLAVALVAAIALAGVEWRAAHRTTPSAVVRFTLPVPQTMLSGNTAGGTALAVSPDGRTIVYAMERANATASLFVRHLDEIEPRALAGTDGAEQPCFSPDGRWIAYLVRGEIWKIPVSGGLPINVGQAPAAPVGLTWSPANLILAGTAVGLAALPASGGTARILARPDTAAGELYFNQPRALSDGETVLLTSQPTGGLGRTRLAALSLRTGVVTRFDLSLLDALALIDGTLVYSLRSGALMAIGLDLRRGRTIGDPVTLGPTALIRISGASEAAVSPTGTLAYIAAAPDAVVGWVDARRQFQPLLADPKAYAYPRLSPDGRRLALAISTGGRADVWAYDIAQATPTRLTTSGTLNDRPEWTPDGKRVLYRGDRGARTAIWWVPADLSGPATPVQGSDAHDFYEGVVTPDGKSLVYQIDDAGAHQADVMYRALVGDTTSRPMAATTFAEAQARVSPDGRWVAYVTDESGASQVVVRPFPGPGGQVQVSSDGGWEPVWERDGRRLFYRDGRHLIAASVTTSPHFAVTGRTELFADDYRFAQAPHANYDVSPDGTRFLMVKSAEAPELYVAYGWLRELRERMRTTGRR
jgi:Tol biopolymer transport system component